MLRTEADVVRCLRSGTWTLDELYAEAEKAGVCDRDAGGDIVHGRTDTRSKRRVRNALQTLRRAGKAERVGDGTWLIEGTEERPRRALLILAGRLGDLELVLGDAAETLRRTEEPIDLIVADPPWGLNRQGAGERIERAYERDSSRVVGGYIDVDSGEYADFTHRWVTAAAEVLRPNGGYLAVITGAQQAARVQVAGEDAGLTYVNAVAVHRPFALRTTRRFAHAHSTVTVLCAGPLEQTSRFFEPPNDLPRARSGVDYPLDWWGDIPKHERPGLVRYDNMLHPRLVRRIVRSLTPGRWEALVADPFLGGGTTALVCLEEERRFLGGDVNAESLRFTMARIVEESPTPLFACP